MGSDGAAMASGILRRKKREIFILMGKRLIPLCELADRVLGDSKGCGCVDAVEDFLSEVCVVTG
jgi:hypothetical protein